MSNHGLDRKDAAEIERRIRLVRQARELARTRKRRRPAPTVAEYDAALGDRAGVSATTRIEDARQRQRQREREAT